MKFSLDKLFLKFQERIIRHLKYNHMGLNNIKTTLIISFFIGILVYHILDVWGIFNNLGIQKIWNLSGAFVTTILFLIISHGKFLMKILMPTKYIGGKFIGIMTNKKNITDIYNFNLNVRQNFLQTIVDGAIFRNGQLVEAFEGFTIKERIHEDINGYFFILINDDNEKKLLKVGVRVMEEKSTKYLIGTFWDLQNGSSYQVDISRPLENIFGYINK